MTALIWGLHKDLICLGADRGKMSIGRKTNRSIQQQENNVVISAQLFKISMKNQLCKDVLVYSKPDSFKKN